MYGCGSLSFPDQLILEIVKFWAKDSYEHIEVLLNSYEAHGAVLYPYYKEEMKSLYIAYKDLYDTLDNESIYKQQKDMIISLIETNNFFIRMLQRLKFAGFNGYPILYTITYHMLYEQMYINEIFKSLVYADYKPADDVLIHGVFRKIGLGNNPISCIYGHAYFWSIIGAEHPSIIISVIKDGINDLPEATVDKFNEFIKVFNKINFELSTIYDDLNPKNLLDVYEKFKLSNKSFLKFLEEFKDSEELLPDNIREQLPDLFMVLLDHMIDEHQYALELCDKIDEFYKNNTYF